MCHASVVIRREAIMSVGAYREDYRHAEDIDLFLRLAEVGTLANLPEVLYIYRQHLGSVGYAQRSEQANATRRAVEAAYKRRGLPTRPRPSAPEMPQSQADAHRKWAWWALMAGNVATARKHALKALIAEPFSSKSLKLAACAIRGH